MLAADQPPKRTDSIRSVDSAASNASLSRKPRTTKLRSRSRSAAADTRRRPSISDDTNGSLSDELYASYSSLKSLSAGNSPLNSPDFSPPPNAQPPFPFLFPNPAQRRPSSTEPTLPQPQPPHPRGRHQLAGPSKVSTTCSARLSFLCFDSQPTCVCRFRQRDDRGASPVVPWVRFPPTLQEVLLPQSTFPRPNKLVGVLGIHCNREPHLLFTPLRRTPRHPWTVRSLLSHTSNRCRKSSKFPR